MTRDFMSKIKAIYAENEAEADGFYQLYSVQTERFGAPVLVNSVDRLSEVVQHLIALSKPGEVLEGQSVKLVFIGYFDAFTAELIDRENICIDVSDMEVI